METSQTPDFYFDNGLTFLKVAALHNLWGFLP